MIEWEIQRLCLWFLDSLVRNDIENWFLLFTLRSAVFLWWVRVSACLSSPSNIFICKQKHRHVCHGIRYCLDLDRTRSDIIDKQVNKRSTKKHQKTCAYTFIYSNTGSTLKTSLFFWALYYSSPWLRAHTQLLFILWPRDTDRWRSTNMRSEIQRTLTVYVCALLLFSVFFYCYYHFPQLKKSASVMLALVLVKKNK